MSTPVSPEVSKTVSPDGYVYKTAISDTGRRLTGFFRDLYSGGSGEWVVSSEPVEAVGDAMTGTFQQLDAWLYAHRDEHYFGVDPATLVLK